MSEIERSRDAELWAKYQPEIELAEALLGPLGAISRYVRERIGVTLRAAEEQGVPLAELAEAIDTRPALGALVFTALEATRRSRIDAKARAFGRAIATGFAATDDAVIDTTLLIVRTIDALEMLHIEALDQFYELRISNLASDGPKAQANSELEDGVDVVRRSYGHTTAVGPIIQVLMREGLLSDHVITGEEPIDVNDGLPGITAYGREVRDYLVDHRTAS